MKACDVKLHGHTQQNNSQNKAPKEKPCPMVQKACFLWRFPRGLVFPHVSSWFLASVLSSGTSLETEPSALSASSHPTYSLTHPTYSLTLSSPPSPLCALDLKTFCCSTITTISTFITTITSLGPRSLDFLLPHNHHDLPLHQHHHLSGLAIFLLGWVGAGRRCKKWARIQANFIVCLCLQINAKFGAAISHHGPMAGPNPSQPKRKPYISRLFAATPLALPHTVWGPFLLLYCFAATFHQHPLLLITLFPRAFYKSKRTNYNNKGLRSPQRVARAANRTLTCISHTPNAQSPQRVARAWGKSHSPLHFAHSTRTISAEGCARMGQIALSPAFRALDPHDLRRGLRAPRTNRTLACISRTRHARSPQRVARTCNKSLSPSFRALTRTISAEGRARR